MATSTNYGWAEPDNSSLVKNGASDIRTLGNAIDTSLWNSGFGQAGKNKIINGDFGIWQRGTSFSNPTSLAFNADRFAFYYDGTGATRTLSRQTFTAGTAPVAGYEGLFFFRYAQTVAGTSNTINLFYQKIENVQTFAGQSVVLSFWAKADSARSITCTANQNFGSGGSADVDTNFTGTANVTTSWQRFSFTATIPSVTGKTIGASSFLGARIFLPAGSTPTIDIWGVQLEYGSVATPFQTASGGSPQSELAMCQRYFLKSYEIGTAPATNTASGANRFRANASTGQFVLETAQRFIIPLRVSPTLTWYSTAGTSGKITNNGSDLTVSASYDYSSTVSPYAYTASSISAGNDVQYHYTASAEL
jgi:hypothetical protein